MRYSKKPYDYEYLEDYKSSGIDNFFVYKKQEKPVLPKSKQSYSKVNKSYLGKSHPKFYRF